jgi:putative endonuclease
MTVFVYALKNQINNEIYVGISSDPERRLKEHNSGKNRYTKAFKPWSIFYTEPFEGFEVAENAKFILSRLQVKEN